MEVRGQLYVDSRDLAQVVRLASLSSDVFTGCIMSPALLQDLSETRKGKGKRVSVIRGFLSY